MSFDYAVCQPKQALSQPLLVKLTLNKTSVFLFPEDELKFFFSKDNLDEFDSLLSIPCFPASAGLNLL